MQTPRQWFASAALGAFAGLQVGLLDAGCPCKGGSVAPLQAVSQMPVGQGFGDVPGFDPMPPTGHYAAGPAPIAPGPPSAPVGAPPPGTDRFAVAPPPGTLGQTYQRRTTLIPDDKHPRMAMVHVHVPEHVDVTARGLKSKWNGKHWVLESEAPLLPGLPHIYAIRTEKTLPSGEKQIDVRWVRLIMGRIVDLEL